jgi:phosphate-selective porin OprO/OprP
MKFLCYRFPPFVLVFILLWSPASAQEFLLGEETKGFTMKVAENTDITLRFRLQPRLDFGDLTTSRDGRRYQSESDLYLRRARLEFGGNLLKNLKYALHLEGDKWGQQGNDDEVDLFYAYLDYKFLDEFSVRGGKAKLPYSRISLTSSTEQLLIERAAATEAAKKVFGDYYQPNLLFHGKFLDGLMNYQLAYADGWEEGKTLRTGNTVRKADPFFGGRIEFSPPGWVEKKKSDAHLGRGRHLTLGIHYALQNAIEYRESASDEDRNLWGFDISGHWEKITFQFEYNQWEEDYSQPNRENKEPKGWYFQAGYFIEGINLEPAVRYEEYDQDSNADDKKQKTWTVGANWYAKGHSLKLSGNWVHTDYEREATGRLADDDQNDIFQIQAQFYF